jgi:formylglycine-generating enzyme required for sulfatase activity
LPVVGVTWFEAALYAAWVGGGLPTESEWIRAATLLKPEVIFATATGDIDPQLAHYDSRLGDGCPVVATTFAATLGGFYGMCGNTWDWSDSGDAMYKVIKGGGYFDSALFCRIEARYRNSPLDRDCTVGFRISVAEDNESFS